ncbi:hypothetical protein LX73_0168 [Fodinibius salinus]|uniref:Uncharacterized protein n=1 Tax=Fodinibius salinus TaxID=860790 RepID=A0A5D3YM13_9BACT|nr:hypothetical protein [Fodinibius salinus]TYP94877.1 hypothetical protein LX73_0168 [Fodinibius salinus]
MSEFEKFKVGKPTRTRFNQSCKPFSNVRHVCHISTAINIIQDHKIKPRLITDKSKLRSTRTKVCWLSPNEWGIGYRYGNVSFEFNIDELIDGKNIYWIESIDYDIPACRFLITNEEKPNLKAYKPKLKNGPWWYNQENDTHYFNGYYCLELMLEEEILLDELLKLEFVKHHSSYCARYRTSPKKCNELGSLGAKAGSLFLAKAVTQALDLSLIKDSLLEEKGEVTVNFENALAYLIPGPFSKLEYNNVIDKESDAVKPIVRGILNSLALDEYDEAKELAKLLDSEEKIIETSFKLVAELMEYQDVDKLIESVYEM